MTSENLRSRTDDAYDHGEFDVDENGSSGGQQTEGNFEVFEGNNENMWEWLACTNKEGRQSIGNEKATLSKMKGAQGATMPDTVSVPQTSTR